MKQNNMIAVEQVMPSFLWHSETPLRSVGSKYLVASECISELSKVLLSERVPKSTLKAKPAANVLSRVQTPPSHTAVPAPCQTASIIPTPFAYLFICRSNILV